MDYNCTIKWCFFSFSVIFLKVLLGSFISKEINLLAQQDLAGSEYWLQGKPPRLRGKHYFFFSPFFLIGSSLSLSSTKSSLLCRFLPCFLVSRGGSSSKCIWDLMLQLMHPALVIDNIMRLRPQCQMFSFFVAPIGSRNIILMPVSFCSNSCKAEVKESRVPSSIQEIFEHNQLRSQCFQVQLSYTLGSFDFILSVWGLFHKL